MSNEKVKIYQLSKSIVDLLPINTYKLNNPIYSIGKIKNYHEKQIIMSNLENYHNNDEQIEISNLDNHYDNISTNTHPIYYYHNSYFMNFPITYFDSNKFDVHKKSYQINYYLDELSSGVVNTYNNYNKNSHLIYNFYPTSKLCI